jgi:DNA primase
VSTPVTWKEIERGFRTEDFRIDNVPDRVREHGDLWKALTLARGRVDLPRLL